MCTRIAVHDKLFVCLSLLKCVKDLIGSPFAITDQVLCSFEFKYTIESSLTYVINFILLTCYYNIFNLFSTPSQYIVSAGARLIPFIQGTKTIAHFVTFAIMLESCPARLGITSTSCICF